MRACAETESINRQKETTWRRIIIVSHSPVSLYLFSSFFFPFLFLLTCPVQVHEAQQAIVQFGGRAAQPLVKENRPWPLAVPGMETQHGQKVNMMLPPLKVYKLLKLPYSRSDTDRSYS
jgi:hypothetical protein